jgi:uncharacterized protein
MKYALVLLAIVVGVWLWRSGRSNQAQATKTAKSTKSTPPPALQDMVSCAVCALHLPQTDALPSRNRAKTSTAIWYCSTEHRQRDEA